MDDLMQWLTTQLDEDEQTAQAATPGPWEQGGIGDYGWTVNFSRRNSGVEVEDGEQGYADAAFIAAHDPARVLREVEAKREIVRQADLYLCDSGPGCGYRTKHGHSVLRLLALAYADRPGYREEWRP
ncbi:MAG: hypothetical protein HOV70_01760 [Streptomyces sp.]|nr:hypothetical protein [Streptomyces sp.]